MNVDEAHKIRTMWLCGALHALTHIYHVALIPLYLLIRQDLQLASDGQATFLVTVLGLAYYLPSYPMGVLADRISRKKLLAIGLAINGLGFAGLSFAPSYPWAIVCLAVAGFGGSFYHPAATAMVARLYPVGTGKALGLVAIGASAGFFIGPIYSGWRGEVAGWRAPVFELGVLGILCAGVFAWLAEERATPNAMVANARSAEKLFPTPALWLFFIASSVAFSLRDFAGGGMGSLSSLFLQRAHGFSPRATGLALAGIFLASAISNPLFGGLSDRGRIRWTCSVLLLAAGMVAIFPRLPESGLIPALVIYGFFFLASYPMVEAAIMESVPDAVRGRVFGLFITMGGLVGNLAHWMVGDWVRRLGDGASLPPRYYALYGFLALLIVLALAGLPCLHAIRKREHLEPSPSGAATSATALRVPHSP